MEYIRRPQTIVFLRLHLPVDEEREEEEKEEQEEEEEEEYRFACTGRQAACGA